MPFPYARSIIGKRHCRVLIAGNVNSDTTGIDMRCCTIVNQPFWAGFPATPTRSILFVEQAGKPVLKIVEYVN